ncbi:hypothetical protein ACA910_002846 [Epithemia clementina (nom. ined.)]
MEQEDHDITSLIRELEALKIREAQIIRQLGECRAQVQARMRRQQSQPSTYSEMRQTEQSNNTSGTESSCTDPTNSASRQRDHTFRVGDQSESTITHHKGSHPTVAD